MVLSWGLASLALAAGGFVLSRMAVSPPRATVSWEQHLGRAGMLLAGLGGVLALVTIVGGLLSN